VRAIAPNTNGPQFGEIPVRATVSTGTTSNHGSGANASPGSLSMMALRQTATVLYYFTPARERPIIGPSTEIWVPIPIKSPAGDGRADPGTAAPRRGGRCRCDIDRVAFSSPPRARARLRLRPGRGRKTTSRAALSSAFSQVRRQSALGHADIRHLSRGHCPLPRLQPVLVPAPPGANALPPQRRILFLPRKARGCGPLL